MKLIIEIPEGLYESQRYAQYFGAWSVVLQKHFENGISLEQIRAEIKKEYEDNVGWCGDNDLYTLGLKKALEIIDRHNFWSE